MTVKLAGGYAALTAVMMSLPASGAVIKSRYAGFVSGNATIDTYGLFGPAGANLGNARMCFTVQYEPSQFGGSQSCGTNCLFNDTIPHSTKRAVSISFTVGSKTLSQTASVSGQVEFSQSGEFVHEFAAAASADINANTGTGVAFIEWFYYQTVFGEKLRRPLLVTNDPQDVITFYLDKGKNRNRFHLIWMTII